MNTKIAGTGVALPKMCRGSDYFDGQLGLKVGTLAAATGVQSRYVCGAETQIDLGVQAMQMALDEAGLDVSDVDLIVSACAVGYQAIPSTAPLFMARLGLADGAAAAFDVNSTCLSFLTGLEMASRSIAAGQYRCAIVVSSEIASRALPWKEDPETAALFGDGAAAVVLTKGSDSGLIASSMKTYPTAYDACEIGAGGTRFDLHTQEDEFVRHSVFTMDGKALFRVSSKYFKTFLDELLASAGWSMDEVDLILPHQASPFALEHMARLAGVSADRLVDISRTHGNQIAASLPFALGVATRAGRVKEGDKVLFLGTSAGVSIGGLAWQF